MVLTEEQRKEFKEATAPLLAFMKKHLHPHTSVIVTQDEAELLEGVCLQKAEKSRLICANQEQISK